jgi:hypothetical protein
MINLRLQDGKGSTQLRRHRQTSRQTIAQRPILARSLNIGLWAQPKFELLIVTGSQPTTAESIPDRQAAAEVFAPVVQRNAVVNLVLCRTDEEPLQSAKPQPDWGVPQIGTKKVEQEAKTVYA